MTIPEQFEVRDIREAGFFWLDNEIIDKYGSRIGAYGLAVYAVLSRHSQNSTQRVSLSQRDIGGILDISQDRTRRSLSDLVELGLIRVEVPKRPSPGIISTITLLRVKTTERHTFSSPRELNATRSRNKEVKTKTETKTKLPPTPLKEGGIIWREVCERLKDDFGTSYVNNAHFQEEAYDKYFRDAWLVEIRGNIAVLDGDQLEVLREGVEKFQERLHKTFHKIGHEISEVRVKESQSWVLEASA